jgi:hypothetical protein
VYTILKNTQKLLEAKDSKDVFLIENGVEKKIGETTEEIRYIQVDGKLAILREQVLRSKVIGNRRGITIVERDSFKPISYTDYSGENPNIRALYMSGEVEVTTSTGVKIIQLECDSCLDVFSIEMILRVVPLKSGYSMQCHAFNAILESEVDIYIEVQEKEAVHRGEGNYSNAWKIKVGFEDVIQYYWIDTEQKSLLKQSSQIGEEKQLEFKRS